jgi:hypothetical protein
MNTPDLRRARPAHDEQAEAVWGAGDAGESLDHAQGIVRRARNRRQLGA